MQNIPEYLNTWKNTPSRAKSFRPTSEDFFEKKSQLYILQEMNKFSFT